MKYIDADRLRAKIERRLDELNPKTGMFGDRPLRAVNPKTFPRERELEKVLDLIDSLQQEQPEVDLEKEIEEQFDRVCDGAEHVPVANLLRPTFTRIARHFYELGLNARKED